MRRTILDGKWLELTGGKVCGMENWRAVRRLCRAGYLRAIWRRCPLRGMEYCMTAAGEAASAGVG